MISLQNVSKRYGEKLAVAPVTLTVPRERCLALIGSSGSGKSTLLRLILGLIWPDTGRITIGGTPMTPKASRGLRLRMGYVVQDGGLFPHLTAADNIALVAHYLHWKPDRVQDRLAELAELVRLPMQLLDRYPSQLSGGERQRVGLIRALMLDPEVLLMDEPLGYLDPIVRCQLQEDLHQIFRGLNQTVLFVTHDMAEAAYLGDQIALMRAGVVVQCGALRELLDHPADPFVTEFIRAQRPLWDEAAAGR